MVARVYAPTRIGDEGDGEVIAIRAVRRFGDQNPNAALEGPTARIPDDLAGPICPNSSMLKCDFAIALQRLTVGGV